MCCRRCTTSSTTPSRLLSITVSSACDPRRLVATVLPPHASTVVPATMMATVLVVLVALVATVLVVTVLAVTVLPLALLVVPLVVPLLQHLHHRRLPSKSQTSPLWDSVASVCAPSAQQLGFCREYCAPAS